MLADFHTLPDSSRIWLYASEKALTTDQQNHILTYIAEHLKGWNAHKVPLTAGVTILENHFIVIALDENKNGASGCSIDTLQKTIQELEKDLSIALMNRLNVFYKIGEIIKVIPSFKLGVIANEDTLFYDLTIQRKEELSNYLKPIKEGWA
ncbi:MAG: ABC transporter ATPase, partial [Flavobacteriales bacterium]|nr:ABC transporter ATPase [Flavobacteriales bacterium]